MTNEEINRAVAEAAGWRCVKVFEWSDDGVRLPKQYHESGECLPDYCNSYDAIMPLVRALRKGKENRFIHALGLDVLKICPLSGDIWMAQEYDCHQMITATPRQLCEAYLAVGGMYHE